MQECKTRLSVADGAGHEYFLTDSTGVISFLVGGVVGTHHVCLRDHKDEILSDLSFRVSVETKIDDKQGVYRDLLQILYRTMCCYSPGGVESIRWREANYRFFVPWILDHVHTARGMQYFTDAARGLVDLLTQVQREDGMIWSQVQPDSGHPDFFDTRDGNRNFYTRRDGEIRLMRQPAENHCEYNFVDCVHLVWKSSGDELWMKEHIDACLRALDYTRNSRARWSDKFGLLKRGYTIDSWDFQVEDEYSVPFPIGTDMCIDEEKTKFGIFFGDNTGYARACDQAAEMLGAANRSKEAEAYEARGREIRERLNKVTWNGKFFRHRVEEDPSVKRKLGVDEDSQVAMSNAYSLNRSISHPQALAIVETYRDLAKHLPPGSPGEWYAIYPPFGTGFGGHMGKWQYMNGGVHAHAAGELARGAFEHGREHYAADILQRLRDLGNAHGGMLHFAYTGAYEPPPPAQTFTPVDLRSSANMNLRGDGPSDVPSWLLEGPENDLRNFTSGNLSFVDVPYCVTDPATNGGKAAIGVARQGGLPKQVEVPVGRAGGALYFLHTASTGASGIGASVTLAYEDGTDHTEYLVSGKHFTGWWFPELDRDNAGIAWRGPNISSACVGLSWLCLENPHPEKVIRSLRFECALDARAYGVVAITLASAPPYRKPDPVSTGGPDNWSGGTTMAALVEGLAGVRDAEGSAALRQVVLSPRWAAAGVDQVKVSICYPASKNYVSYSCAHQPSAKKFELLLTGNAENGTLRLLLPGGASSISRATIDDQVIEAQLETIEESVYATLPLDTLRTPQKVELLYS